jgi:modulator of FtsH protease
MGSGALAGWTDFFAADAGASAALAGLLFVAVSINLGRILEFSRLPLRAGEALVALLSVLFVATVGLVPGQSDYAYGLKVAAIGLAT